MKGKIAILSFALFTIIQTTLLLICKFRDGMQVNFFAFFVFVMPAAAGLALSAWIRHTTLREPKNNSL